VGQVGPLPLRHPSCSEAVASCLDFASFVGPCLPFLEGSYREGCQGGGHHRRPLEAVERHLLGMAMDSAAAAVTNHLPGKVEGFTVQR